MSEPIKNPTAVNSSHDAPDQGVKRRDFLVLSAQAMGGLGAAALIWPFVDSMNPAADVLALAALKKKLKKQKRWMCPHFQILKKTKTA